jgi:hypothetical protein
MEKEKGKGKRRGGDGMGRGGEERGGEDLLMQVGPRPPPA